MSDSEDCEIIDFSDDETTPETDQKSDPFADFLGNDDENSDDDFDEQYEGEMPEFDIPQKKPKLPEAVPLNSIAGGGVFQAETDSRVGSTVAGSTIDGTSIIGDSVYTSKTESTSKYTVPL